MLDLEAIKERIARLDKGEWGLSWRQGIVIVRNMATRNLVVWRNFREKDCPPHIGGVIGFIMHSRRDMPELIAEVERLREGLNLWIAARTSDQCALVKAKRELVSHRAERDEANANAARLRTDRDRWHDAATVLSVEFAKADDRAIAAAEKAESLRAHRDALLDGLADLQKTIRGFRAE